MLKQDRDEAIIYLYTKYSKTVFGRCFVLVRDYSLAEDCMQETFARLNKSYDSLDDINVIGWLMNTSVYVCREVMRKRAREGACVAEISQEIKPDGDEEFRETPDKGSLFELLEEEEFRQSLSPNDRKVYDLRFRKDMKIADVAAALGCTVPAAKMRIKRLLKHAEKYFMKK